MILNIFKFIVVIVSLFGCAHNAKVNSSYEDFTRALASLQEGNESEAKQTFERLCRLSKEHVACFLLGRSVSWKPQLAIMQGASSASLAQFSVVQGRNQDLHFYAFTSEDLRIQKASALDKQTWGGSRWSVTNFNFDTLAPRREYTLLVVDSEGQLIDYRIFKSLQATASTLSFALLSCMRDDLKGIEGMWAQVQKQRPDALFMIGDNVYIDHGVGRYFREITPDKIWQRHVQTRKRLQIFREKRLTPVYATWDDHDYGKGNGDHTFTYKNESREIFARFFPMQELDGFLHAGPGLSRSIQTSNQQFIFLDNRTFRVEADAKKIGSHFGKAQTEWALNQISKFKGPTWLISGDQFFGGYQPFDSFQGNHALDFTNFLKDLRKTQRTVLFASGDRHMSELQRIPPKFLGYSTYELTSSPIHSSVYPGALGKHANPYRLDGVDGLWNFMMVTSVRNRGQLSFEVKDYDQKKKLHFSKKLGLKVLN